MYGLVESIPCEYVIIYSDSVRRSCNVSLDLLMKVICRMDFHALKLESLKQMVEFFNPSHLGQNI